MEKEEISEQESTEEQKETEQDKTDYNELINKLTESNDNMAKRIEELENEIAHIVKNGREMTISRQEEKAEYKPLSSLDYSISKRDILSDRGVSAWRS